MRKSDYVKKSKIRYGKQGTKTFALWVNLIEDNITHMRYHRRP